MHSEKSEIAVGPGGGFSVSDEESARRFAEAVRLLEEVEDAGALSEKRRRRVLDVLVMQERRGPFLGTPRQLLRDGRRHPVQNGGGRLQAFRVCVLLFLVLLAFAVVLAL